MDSFSSRCRPQRRPLDWILIFHTLASLRRREVRSARGPAANPNFDIDVRFWGQSGHDLLRRDCLLLTQSGYCYLPSFQISAASFHSPRTFSHTTRYFPEISFGVGSLVINLNVTVSRAGCGRNRLTSRVVTCGLLTCSASPFHIAPIAALPLTIAEPGQNAIASTV